MALCSSTSQHACMKGFVLFAFQVLEREAKRIAEDRFQRERELQQREAEEDKRRKKEAFLR